MRFWLVLSAWAVVLVASVSPLRAQTDDERARSHFEAGRSYYEQARYDDAAREWQAAFDLSGRPELLLNISQAAERALRYDDAIGAARHYLTLQPNASDRKTIEERIASLEQLRERLRAGTAPTQPAPPSPVAAPGATPEGSDGASSAPPTQPSVPPVGPEAPIGTPAAQAPASTIEPEAQAREPELISDSGSSGERPNRFSVPAIVLMGTGGAALVASLVTGLVAHSDYESLKRQCDDDGRCPEAARDELDEGKSFAAASTVLAIVGVLAAGTGAALLIVGAGGDEAEGEARAGRVAIGPGLTPLSLQGTLSF